MKKYILHISIFCLVACSKTSDITPSGSNSSENPNVIGKGGSLARFSIYFNSLYVVDDVNLQTFDISDLKNPTKTDSLLVGSNIETIYNFKNRLFIGSQRGVFFYSIENQFKPKYLSNLTHQWSCDPVVADDSIAYVTLSANGNGCNRGLRRLDIISIKSIENPELISSIPMTNPKGLALNKDYLLVCDESMKIFKRKSKTLELVYTSENIDAYDIILSDSLAIITTSKGIYQYLFKNEKLVLLSKI